MPIVDTPLCFTEVLPLPIDFLWDPYIPLGKITLLASDPGLGKSALTLTLASLLSNNLPLPSVVPNRSPNRKPPIPSEERPPAPAEEPPIPSIGNWQSEIGNPPPPPSPSATVFLSPEDNLNDTIRPRLDALGANLSHIHSLRFFPPLYPTPDYPDPIKHLRETLRPIDDLQLLVIDPITYYLGSTDRKLAPEHRSVLHALSSLAESLHIAILLTTRLTKRIPPRASRRALVQLFGSLAFTSVARSVILLTQHPTTPNRRLFVPIKSNLTALPPPLSLTFNEPPVPNRNHNPNPNRKTLDPLQNFSPAPADEPPHLTAPIGNWQSEIGNPPPTSSNLLPSELLTPPTLEFDPTPIDPDSLMDLLSEPKPEPDLPLLESAQEFILSAVQDGPCKVETINKAAVQAHIAARTLQRAKSLLPIRSRREPLSGKWFWCLKDDDRPLKVTSLERMGPIGGQPY